MPQGLSENTNLFIRTDAGLEIGSGHLMRCFALAQSWRAQGGKVTFITKCENATLLGRLEDEGFEIIKIENSYPHQSDWGITGKILNDFPRAWCVVDGYHFDSAYYSLIRKNGNRVLVVDDTAHLDFYDADAILNQNINASELNYHHRPETHLLLGTQFAMLRQEFLKWRNWERDIPVAGQKILVTMGGSDFQNQTLKAIRAVQQLKIKNLQVRAVVGAGNPHHAELENAVVNSLAHIDLIKSAEDMSELMAWADACVAAAGSTCWELCFMKLPSVLIVSAENQLGLAQGLSEIGGAENLGWFELVSERDLSENLRELLLDEKRRRKMSETGRGIVDGRGAGRVTEFLSR